MKIKVLPDDIANKIAAGEVVERPVSVVRELIDNSLDAGASEIQVIIQQGGKKLIQVIDNGEGMERADALLAFERHATSKIKTAHDLFSIQTHGFRGEALPSIASISKVKLKTRRETDHIGVSVVIEGGKMIRVSDESCIQGTDILIQNLFFNTPVRKKFLSSEKVESARIEEYIRNVSLAYPDVRFIFESDGERVSTFHKVKDSTQRAALIFKGAHIKISREDQRFSLTGLIGHPSLSETVKMPFVVIVNHRVVFDRLLLRAVREGFDSMLKDKESPVGFLSFTLPFTELDCNVHPQKLEIKFQNREEVFTFVRDAVREALSSFSHPRPLSQQILQKSFPQSSSRQVTYDPISVRSFPLFEKPQSIESGYSMIKEELSETEIENAAHMIDVARSSFPYSSLKYVGQIFECYLLFVKDDSLYVLDMHAAHERVNFNKIRTMLSSGVLPSQKLLLPIQLYVPDFAVASLAEKNDLLSALGFECEFATQKVIIHSYSGVLKESSVKDIITKLSEEDFSDGYKKHIDLIAARLACHASIRSGDLLHAQEAYALMKDLEAAEMSSACPHGRPVLVTMKEKSIEALFGR